MVLDYTLNLNMVSNNTLNNPIAMKFLRLKTFIVCMFMFINLNAQSIYIDPVSGNDNYDGSSKKPFLTLEKAFDIANQYDGTKDIALKLYPGLYIIDKALEIKVYIKSKMTFTVEAVIMPDDFLWKRSSMPVILSTSANNSTTQFDHCTGFLVGINNVVMRGLKFLGNADPGVKYYYPITREKEDLHDLNISQCYFIGERNTLPIQSGIWAHGSGINISNCIFYKCKNALVLLKSIRKFSFTNSLVIGAYEAAIWFGPMLEPFKFSNNIISDCNYFLVRPQNTRPEYVFSNSIISNNRNYLGFFTADDLLVPSLNNNVKENKIIKNATVVLSEVTNSGVPKDYLNPIDNSQGKKMGIGIFKYKGQ